ncbi:MAG: hypothetical protein LBQ68_02840 [Clostridiales bacterium]|jgi:type II secretory pathway pseudopilin PulG|nr:hypothetical protein [Clostridiales bacterium]
MVNRIKLFDCRNPTKKAQEGYSFLEILISMSVMMILFASVFKVLDYSSSTAAKAVVREELLESARTAMDIMLANIQLAERVEVTTGGSILQSMKLCEKNNPTKVYGFSYDISASSNSANYHRLQFSEPPSKNELASNLAEVNLLQEGETIRIIITTDDHITANINSGREEAVMNYATVVVQPIVLQASVSVIGKEVICHAK